MSQFDPSSSSNYATNREAAARPNFIGDTSTNLRRWFTRTFTLENLFVTLKTLAWVTPLTILIWVYAEREQVTSRPVTIPIAVKSVDPNRIVRLRSGDESVSAQISGPNAA